MAKRKPGPAPAKIGLEGAVSASNVVRSSDQMRHHEVLTNIIVIWLVAPISVSDITDGYRKVSYRTQGW